MTRCIPALPVSEPNIYPFDWRTSEPRFAHVYEKAKANVWNPSALDWGSLASASLDHDQRVAVAYMGALLGMFEFAAAPQFLLPLHYLYEHGEDHAGVQLCMATGRDEFLHEELGKRIAETLIPGFPFCYEPTDPLEQAAVGNLRWIEFKQARMWATYRDKIFDGKNPWIAQLSIWAPEVTGMVLFRAIGQSSPIPFLRDAYTNVDRDEVRHVAYGRILFEQGARKGLSQDDRDRLVKLCNDGVIYAGAMLQLPALVEHSTFWRTPEDLAPPRFAAVHAQLLGKALETMTGGMTPDEMFEACRGAVLKVRWLLEKNGCDVTSSELPLWRTFKITSRDKSLEEDYSLEASA